MVDAAPATVGLPAGVRLQGWVPPGSAAGAAALEMAFEVVDDERPSLPGLWTGYCSQPAFADLDADGDLDLLGQTYNFGSGAMDYFENVGTPTEANFQEITGPQNPFEGLDVAEENALLDVDGDGDLDLLSSDWRRGTLFENVGTPTRPRFAGGVAFPAIAGATYGIVGIDDDGDTDPFVEQGLTMILLRNEASSFTDQTPALCGPLQVIDEDGRIVAVEISPSDPESGIRSVGFVTMKNATGTVDGTEGPFSAGDLHTFAGEPTGFTIRADKTDPSKRATVVIEITNGAGLQTTCDPVMVTVTADLPAETSLSQNYPNPFNPQTLVRFSLAEAGPVSVRIYDATGRLVARLIEGDHAAGVYEIMWDGTDDAGRMLPSGVYLYRLATDAFVQTRAMFFVK